MKQERIQHTTQTRSTPTRRRHWLQGAAIVAVLCLPAWAQSPVAGQTKAPRMGRNLPPGQALREMQIFKVKAIGLEVWVENMPPWKVQTVQNNGRAVLAVSSPENYHPPAAMTFASWPEHRVRQEQVQSVALSTLRQAAQNFGLTAGQARALEPRPAQHGVLTGYEIEFVGKVQGTAMDVRLYFGLQPDRPPVVMTAYTLKDKMGHLKDVLRRSWGNVSYLD